LVARPRPDRYHPTVGRDLEVPRRISQRADIHLEGAGLVRMERQPLSIRREAGPGFTRVRAQKGARLLAAHVQEPYIQAGPWILLVEGKPFAIGRPGRGPLGVSDWKQPLRRAAPVRRLEE